MGLCLNIRREGNLCKGVTEGRLRFSTTNTFKGYAAFTTPDEILLMFILRQCHDNRTDVSEATRCHCSATEKLKRIKRWHKNTRKGWFKSELPFLTSGRKNLNMVFNTINNVSLNILKTDYMSRILGKGEKGQRKRNNGMCWFENLELWERFVENLAWKGNKRHERHCWCQKGYR